MKKLLNKSTNRFVLNLLKGAGMLLSCALVASCGPDNKTKKQGGDQKGAFADKEEMILFFIDNKKLSREEAEKIVTDDFFEKNKDNKDALKTLTRENLLGDSEALQKKVNEEKQKIEQKKGDSNPTSQKTLAKGNGESINKETPSLEGDEGGVDEKAPSIKLVDDERIKENKYLPIKAGVTEDCIVALKINITEYDGSNLEAVSSNENVKAVFDKDNSSIDVGIGTFGEEILVPTTISLREKNSGKVLYKFELCLVDEAYKGYWEGTVENDFAEAAKKCIEEGGEASDLGKNLSDLKNVSDGLFKVWNAIEGESFRKKLNLVLNENTLRWGNKMVNDVKNNLQHVVDVLDIYNGLFPDKVVRFVLDKTNVDLASGEIKNSLTHLVRLGENVDGKVLVGKSNANNKFGFGVGDTGVLVGEWDEGIDDLKKCLDCVAALREDDSLKNAGFLSDLFNSVGVVNGTAVRKIKVSVGEFVVDNCVDFGQFDTLGGELSKLEGVINLVGKCFSYSIDNDNKVFLKVGGGDIEILILDSEGSLKNLGKLIGGTEKWFSAGLGVDKINLSLDGGKIKIGNKGFDIVCSSKEAFDMFVSAMSDIKKYWGFNGNFGNLNLGNGVLMFGVLNISVAGKEDGFFSENGSFQKAVGLGLVENSIIDNLVEGDGDNAKKIVKADGAADKVFDFGKVVWKNDGDIDDTVLGRYFVKKVVV